MTEPTKTKQPNTGKPKSPTLVDFEYTSLGILISSYKANGVHIANEDKYLELYVKEMEIAYNNGRTSLISDLSEE